MPDLNALEAFATERRHNLTGPVRHDQVVALADAWLPEIRFHEGERFHPVDLPALLEIPDTVFAGLPEGAKDELRVAVATQILPNGQLLIERFDPPVVHVPNGIVRQVLASGAAATDALDELELGRSGVFTYGARLGAAREFFGASVTVAGVGEPAPGDPRAPRHLPLRVRAELRMLLETLKHELELDELPEELVNRGLPIDAIWSGFAVEDAFFISPPGAEDSEPFPRFQKREILGALVAAHEAGDEAAEAAALARIPTGHRFISKAWDTVKGFAFLEYYLVYPFNDYKEYGTWPFENEHEGDIEGCCVVFERRVLEEFAAGTVQAEEVIPHTVITSVHEEFNDSDRMKRLSVVRDRARDDLLVYVAPGSHATYLTPGSHDILDFEDVVTDLPAQLPDGVIILGLLTNILPVLALLAGIFEHFVDSEDQTSDNGVSVGPGPPDPGSLRFDKRIEVTPLSDIESDTNIYQREQRSALAVRAFPGKWGGDSGLIDKSPPWENKTARYFRRFLRGDIEPTIVLV